MIGLGVALLVLWALAQVFGAVFGFAVDVLEVLLKVSFVLIAVGIVINLLTGFRAYRIFKR